VRIEAVIFDWGGTLSEFVDVELVDAWRLAAKHLDPGHEDELTDRLVQVEADF
jgi:putative hydrolase of the HAD superfamily